MQDLFIIHYYPLENYPPVQNLINTISDRINVTIITTGNVKSSFKYDNSQAVIHRPCAMRLSFSALRYVYFVVYSIILLVIKRPLNVLYYEPISVLPAYLYKRYINRRSKVYIHYHEYYSEEDYTRPGTRLWAINHKLERNWLYQNATWVSQTNLYRLNMFLENNPLVESSTAHVFPNYPPKTWHTKIKHHGSDITKCVYVGSLSLEDTFVKEFCEWVSKQSGKITFDIYSYNFHNDTLEVISSLNCPHIKFHTDGIPYEKIPDILNEYDVGMLLYKAKNVNFQWNETNKFYEYLICGLDVWYPKEMLLLHEMDKSKFAPKIVEVDFKDINIELENTSRRIDNSSYSCFADEVYNDFYKHLNQ